jgi:hypothetical protein
MMVGAHNKEQTKRSMTGLALVLLIAVIIALARAALR